MKLRRLAAASSACLVAVAFWPGTIQAHPTASALSPPEIAKAIKGKTCLSKAGGKFSFGIDGTYYYDGLWKSSGNYIINWNSVKIVFDSGLSRYFSISLKNGDLIIEETVIMCYVVD